MKFSKYISKAVTPVMALFQKQHGCLSNKATTICGYSVCSLRQVPVRHNRGGKSTENKVRFAPPTMCRLTVKCRPTVLRYGCLHLFCNDYTLLRTPTLHFFSKLTCKNFPFRPFRDTALFLLFSFCLSLSAMHTTPGSFQAYF